MILEGVSIMVQIQVQDTSGNWRTFNIVPNVPAIIQQAMKSLSSNHAGKRIRAIDMSGNIIDIL